MAAFLLGFVVVKAQDRPVHPTSIVTGTFIGISKPLRDLPKMTQQEFDRLAERAKTKQLNESLKLRSYPFASTALPKGPDPVWQNAMGKSGGNRAPIANFNGQDSPYYPPDCNGAVGPNHYMQDINCVYSIYTKSGTLVAGPTNMNLLFGSVPGATYNDGDPVVLYDEQAGRWLATEFSISGATNYILMAVSTTGDPTGTWYQYSFVVASMPDYPKFGVWRDGYYMADNNSSGKDIYVFQRSQMLTGGTALSVGFANPNRPTSVDGFMMVPPVDNDGAFAPAGSPGTFIAFNDDAIGGGTDQLWIYELTANWTTPANSTFSRVQQINVAAFSANFGSTWNNISQSGSTQKVDAIPQVIMNVPQYRNFGSYQTIVCCHTVDVDGSYHAGIRWYELRRGTQTSGNWAVRQQGTYAPDAHSRWMGSIMLNGSGKIGLGYSISSTSLFPGIRYCGQSSSAYNSASGTMDLPEEIIQTGAYSQSSYNRWGDYSDLSVDPTDDNTFWFTTEYIGSGGARKTKIASFKFGNDPAVVTLAATSVIGSTATINGTVNPNGLATTYYFQWGTTPSYGNNTTSASAGSGATAVAVSANLTGLTSGTTYHFSLVATNSDGTSTGSDLTFTPGAAVVTTTAASVITTNSATSGGNVISDGGLSVTARGVCWSTSINPTIIPGSYTTNGSGIGVFTSSLTGLSASTLYHVRAYATNSSGTYYGDDLTFTTLCGTITSFPWNEGFENAGLIPNCWTQEQVNSSGLNFTFVTGNGASNPAAAHGGTYNACLKDATTADNITKLITPSINLVSLGSPVLKFWHTQAVSSTRQDKLIVYYKTAYTAAWTTLATYTTSITAWTEVTINLPNASSDYYIAFEGNAKRGYGVCIDDVSITGTVTPTLTVTPSDRPVTAAAGTTSFTATTGSAWTASSNQTWCTVTPSGTGTGTIAANYTQNTTSSSRVANITVTVSGVTPVVVTVSQAAPTLSVTPPNQPVTADPGTTSFSVTSNSTWAALSDQSWCTVTPSGTGSGSITAIYSANALFTSRVANITVTASGTTPVFVTVTQAAIIPAISVTPTDRPVTPAAGTASFAVTSNSAWIASSNQTWCTVTPSGTGSGTITANYTINNTASLRVATVTVTVAGLTPVVVTVTQAAPTLSVTPSDQSVPYISGYTSFTITSNTAWIAESDQAWCTVTPTDSGTITATCSENHTYSARIANLTVNVAGLSPVVVTVTQAAAPLPEFNYTIANDVQTSDKTLEFDLYLLDYQPSIPFELSIIQSGILVNSEIIDGGNITTSILSGFSELVAVQQPTGCVWATGTLNGCIKITPKAGPGCGNGTIISTTGLGTRICRVRITNTVPFTAGSQANLAFNFTTAPYPTKVFQYSGIPCISTTLTTSTANCFSLATNPVLNGPPALSVSPSDQPVYSPAGSIPFVVTANANWTATSNQTWCTVTPYGYANGTITANYDANPDPSPRVANVTVTVAGLTPVVVTVTQAGAPLRTVNLTVFLEGLYTGNSTMHPAMDEVGYHWGETIADNLTIELHDGSNYSNIVYTATDVSLNTNGTASITLSSYYNGYYYVTIRQRNHILTTTALPILFHSSTINYAFDAPGKAYGGNLLLMIDGKYVFYAGDVNQDGLVDGTDLSDIDNRSTVAANGYLPEDVNGDGLIDGSDLSIAGNNADIAIGVITP